MVLRASVLGTKTSIMKILHVLHHSVPAPLDGYAIRSHALLRAQQAAGLNVRALTGSQRTNEVPEGLIDGIHYLRTPASGAKIFAYEQLRRYRLLRSRLLEAVHVERPDVIHVHSPVYNGLAALSVSRRTGIPLVYEMRALWEDAAVDQRRFSSRSVFYRVAGSLEAYLLRHAGAVVTICNGLKQVATSRGAQPDKVFVVGNGVNADELHPMPADRGLAANLGLDGGIVIGFIGSLFKFEGIEDLLDAVPGVLEACPDVRFLIVGSGERQEYVAKRAAELSKSGRFVYRPGVPHSEVRRYYSIIDCLVYPRRSVRLTELVTPLKPLEAMAMQKTVVASDIGGHRELIANGSTGLLYSLSNPSSLTETLCAVAASPDLRNRLAASARNYVVQERQWQRLIASDVAAYRTALAAY